MSHSHPSQTPNASDTMLGSTSMAVSNEFSYSGLLDSCPLPFTAIVTTTGTYPDQSTRSTHAWTMPFQSMTTSVPQVSSQVLHNNPRGSHPVHQALIQNQYSLQHSFHPTQSRVQQQQFQQHYQQLHQQHTPQYVQAPLPQHQHQHQQADPRFAMYPPSAPLFSTQESSYFMESPTSTPFPDMHQARSNQPLLANSAPASSTWGVLADVYREQPKQAQGPLSPQPLSSDGSNPSSPQLFNLLSPSVPSMEAPAPDRTSVDNAVDLQLLLLSLGESIAPTPRSSYPSAESVVVHAASPSLLHESSIPATHLSIASAAPSTPSLPTMVSSFSNCASTSSSASSSAFAYRANAEASAKAKTKRQSNLKEQISNNIKRKQKRQSLQLSVVSATYTPTQSIATSSGTTTPTSTTISSPALSLTNTTLNSTFISALAAGWSEDSSENLQATVKLEEPRRNTPNYDNLFSRSPSSEPSTSFSVSPSLRPTPSASSSPQPLPLRLQESLSLSTSTTSTSPSATATATKSSSSSSTSAVRYICEYCERSFERQYNLNAHIRTHTHERIHRCNVCNKVFLRPYDLSRHQRIHNNIRPYKCTLCHKVFIRNDAIWRHYRSSHADHPDVPISRIERRKSQKTHSKQ
ncbi:hypothetical protein BG004_002793 [Podila humilis]|nr:hypothetical protein BG004_002793 [Podila humilis]